VSKLGFKQVSTGDLCRREIAKGTETGQKIDFLIKSGKLVPDDLITQMVYDWFQEQPDDGTSVILDGYPRTVRQAELLQKMISNGILPFQVVVIELALDDEIIVHRLSSRLVCQNKRCQKIYSANPDVNMLPEKEGICDACGGEVGRRKDDVPEVIRERLRVYHEHAQPLVDFYITAEYRVLKLDANRLLLDILHQFEHEIDGLVL
jgi:adenylate kinase